MKLKRCFNTLGAFAMVVCLAVTFLPATFFAAKNENDVALPENLPEDTIYISTVEDLEELAENCRVNTWSIDKTVVLENDIQMDQTDFKGIPSFGGTFYGMGYSISGLYLYHDGSVVGFFRYLQETAVVQDLVINGTVQPEGSKSIVGGFAGSNAGTIINCGFNGTVSGTQQVGGLVGINKTTALIEDCDMTGTVYGNHFIGGIAGENHGVIRMSRNHAEVNTQSVQNAVSLEDISVDSLTTTESAATTTDIGGIVGTNSGVIRACVNNANVGYQNMGYNVGGIAGNQSGYIAECTNNAEIHGRKEVGGIVGHMEPNVVIRFSADGLEVLSTQLKDLEKSMDALSGTIEADGDTIENQMNTMESDLTNAQNALDALIESLNVEDVDDVEDLDNIELPDDFGDIELPDDLEGIELPDELETSQVDKDKAIAAMNDFSDAIGNLTTSMNNLSDTVSKSSDNLGKQIDGVSTQIKNITQTVDTLDDTINVNVHDTSDSDTELDTLGKVANSYNHGRVQGEYNVGGIAGIISEETEVEAYEDVETEGDVSLNIDYETRAVIRGSKNYGNIVVSKQGGGGIAGQMLMGCVLECVNLGNIDAINADNVGGIVGDSYTIIRNCSSKSMISGDKCVGGIAGKANEVTDCYSFVEIKAYTEKAGTVIGEAKELPEGEEPVIYGNYYFVPGVEVGAIDGVTYTGATDRLSLDEFLALEGLDETFAKVDVRFVVEGQDDIVISLSTGDNLSIDQIPALKVEDGEEYQWEIVTDVTSEVLGMGEIARVDLLSKESITSILFNQTYKASFDTKNTVIRSKEYTENYLAVMLAEGKFATNTVLNTVDVLSQETTVNGKAAFAHWQVTLSNPGVSKLHFYIPEGVNADFVQILVKDADGKWAKRDFIVEGSYAIFEYSDTDTAFALVKDAGAITFEIIKYAAVALIALTIISKIIKKRKKNKTNS